MLGLPANHVLILDFSLKEKGRQKGYLLICILFVSFNWV